MGLISVYSYTVPYMLHFCAWAIGRIAVGDEWNPSLVDFLCWFKALQVFPLIRYTVVAHDRLVIWHAATIWAQTPHIKTLMNEWMCESDLKGLSHLPCWVCFNQTVVYSKIHKSKISFQLNHSTFQFHNLTQTIGEPKLNHVDIVGWKWTELNESGTNMEWRWGRGFLDTRADVNISWLLVETQ